MFKKKETKKDVTKSSHSFEPRKPTLREIEEMFVSDDYPLKGKKPNQKPF